MFIIYSITKICPKHNSGIKIYMIIDKLVAPADGKTLNSNPDRVGACSFRFVRIESFYGREAHISR